MKTMKRLGCLLALVLFAGATAQAAEWFKNVVDGTTVTGWKFGGAALTTWEGKWVSGHIEFTDWNNTLNYAPDSTSFAGKSKDTAVSTQVKFSAMDLEDLTGEGAVNITGAKAGLTVAQPEGGDKAYYGIAQGTEGKEWVQLTGMPSDDYVTVTVELFKKGTGTFVNYKIGDTLLALASDEKTTDIQVDVDTTTIASVEYLGQCNIATLAGDAWSNPCTITLPTLPTGIAGYTAFDENGNVVNLNSVARGTVLSFGDFMADKNNDPTKYYTVASTGKKLLVDDDWTVESWATYVTVDEKTKEQGKDYPSTITVDETIIAARKAAGAASDETKGGYLYTQQSNGQLGWVNYSLGIADNATIAPTNAPQTYASAVIVNFGIDVDDNANVKYVVGGKASDTPDITIGEKGNNQKVVDVALVLVDEGDQEHTIKTVSVGVMETGKDVQTTGTTFDIVAVPWESMGGGAVTVNNLLNTAYLNDGDTLYIWNQDKGLYDTYSWSGTAWEAGNQTVRDSAVGKSVAQSEDPATKTIAKNTAIWIERDTTSRIVFAGIVTDKTETHTATVAAGGKDQATWSLIANPSIKSFDLSTITGAEGDMIIVEDAADPREYTYENDAWGYVKTTGFEEKKGPRGQTIRIRQTTRCTTENTIPPGVGFWYVRAAGASEFTITFGDNNVSKN